MSILRARPPAVRAAIVLTATASLGLPLVLAQPVSAAPGDRPPARVKTEVTLAGVIDPTTFDYLFFGTVSARDGRCVAQRKVRVFGTDTRERRVDLGSTRARRGGGYDVQASGDVASRLESFTATVTRLRTAGRRPALCSAARATIEND